MTDYGYVDVGKLADFANNTIGGLTANDIMRFPKADVQPVRHGKWIIADDVEQFIAVCSECGRTEDSRGIKDMPYCHCGARMDLNGGDTNG